jgi:hypothetical protein
MTMVQWWCSGVMLWRIVTVPVRHFERPDDAGHARPRAPDKPPQTTGAQVGRVFDRWG